MTPTYYQDNPNLEFRVVDTFNGRKEYRINCKKILGDYYVMNVDCFLVENKWYRTNSGLIIFDAETKQWVAKNNPNLIGGIVSFDGDAPVLGEFTANPFNNCIYSDVNNVHYHCINPEILIHAGKVEDVSNGIWYDNNSRYRATFQSPRNVLNHKEKGYSIEDNQTEYELKKKLFSEYKTPLNKNVTQYGKMLGDTTFGIEIECSHGNLPEHLQNRYGTVICRDGSLNDENGLPGPEFVTVPMSGAKGLQTMNNLATDLSKRTRINLNCSFHIHFGTLPTSRIFLVSLYKLCAKIQDEMFTMFPYYKAQPAGIKNKNYNQKLPPLNLKVANPRMSKDEFDSFINAAYYKMFSWLADGYIPDKQRNRTNKKHPALAKWDRHARYYWINFMNAIFSERNTVEFRLHTPTTNAQKMSNWLFICNAIVKYSMNNSRKILLTNSPITLDEVMDYYKHFGATGEFLSDYLKAYIESKKNAFLEDYKNGDKVSAWDYNKDDEYSFSFANVKNLY